MSCMVFNIGMRIHGLLPILSAFVLLPACTQTVRIVEVADLPVKDVKIHNMDWEVSPLRANYQYVFHGAYSNKARLDRVGDYYFLSWYDAEPDKPVRIVMQYTQAGSASQLRSCSVEYAQPRRSAGYRKINFQFIKEEAATAAIPVAEDTAIPEGVTPVNVRFRVPDALLHGTVRVPVNVHAKDGDVLSWRMDVYCGGETTPRDTRKSFLWN